MGEGTRWDRVDEEVSHDEVSEEAFALENVQTTLSNSTQVFEKSDYATASSDFKEALALIAEMPERLRRICDLTSLHFKHAVCAFHVDDTSVAEEALKSVIEQPS